MTTTPATSPPRPTTLASATLDALPAAVGRPTYDRAAVTASIVHFGVGGFHRAHQAMYVDRLMELGVPGALDWGICGVGALPHDRRIVDTLTAQDGLYTLVVKHPDGHREPRVVGSLVELVFAPDDPQAVVDRLAHPRTRIVSLTITEGGYLVNQVTGEFDAADPAIRADLEEGAVPRTVFGYVVAGLAARRDAGQEPFTVMSCDNLPGNGDVARTMMTAYARLKDPALADWMDEHVSFPNGMVDRITPVTVQDDIDRLVEEFGVEDGWPVVCEPFTQWVLEDHFTQGRPALEAAGVQLVEDVVPYELMKLRLLNASHQALCYPGYMEHEGSPTLPDVPGVDLDAYRHELIARFANPEVRDTLARLCAESSDRIPKWLVPVIRRNLETGGQIDSSALVVASWARYAEGVDEQGEPIEVVDRVKDRVMAADAQQGTDPLAFLRDRDLFGDLVDDERFTSVFTRALSALHTRGARETLQSWTGRSSTT